MKRLVGLAVAGDPILETRQIDNLHEVPLKVSVSTLDFNMASAQKVELFGQGYDSALRVFGTPGFPVEPDRIRKKLSVIVDAIKQLSGIPSAHVRACVICRASEWTIRVSYTFNMESSDDTDDQLEFNTDAGVAGECLRTGRLMSVDMDQAKVEFESRWKLSKYQQALVRKDLKSLICVPILAEDGSPMAVLSLDSTSCDMLGHFASEGSEAVLTAGAASIAKALQRGAIGEKESA